MGSTVVNRRWPTTFGIVFLLCASCSYVHTASVQQPSSAPEQPSGQPPIQSGAGTVAMSAAPRGHPRKYNNPLTVDNLFTMRLYRALSATPSESGNMLFSPVSVIAALAALQEGANGSTADEIRRALNRSVEAASQHRQSTARALHALRDPAAARHSYSLSVVGRAFVQSGLPMSVDFTNTLLDVYGTDTESVDFGRPSAAEARVNQWVSDATFGRIAQLLAPGSLDVQTRLVLANAVYFKGEWETMFDEASSRPRPFYTRPDQPPVQVPTMSLEADLPYADFHKLGFEMLELPYVGGQVSFFVVLPHEDQSLERVARRLLHRPYLLTDPRRRLYAGSVLVSLPRFALEETVDLKRALSALGVRRAFVQGRADFSRMLAPSNSSVGSTGGGGELYVSDAVHKAALKVDEKGTKAAAASGFVLKGRSMRSEPEFRADRPFLFFVRHHPTATMLFAGHVKSFDSVVPTAVVEQTGGARSSLDNQLLQPASPSKRGHQAAPLIGRQ